MILLLFYAAYLILSALVVGAALVIYASFCLLAFAVALVIWIIRSLVERKKSAPPKVRRSIPQARWSSRR